MVCLKIRVRMAFGGNSACARSSEMQVSSVKSILLLNSSDRDCSSSLLFHCAWYWAQRGSRVLFISKTPLKSISFAVGKADAVLNPDAFKLIQFMYLNNWEELLKQLYSIHLRHSPVSVIIVKNVEKYFINEDHVSLICASLLFAASMCAKLVTQPVFLINEYVSENSVINKVVIKNFFHNVWELEKTQDENKETFKLSKLSFAQNNEIIRYTTTENSPESSLSFDEVIKKIIHKC